MDVVLSIARVLFLSKCNTFGDLKARFQYAEYGRTESRDQKYYMQQQQHDPLWCFSIKLLCDSDSKRMICRRNVRRSKRPLFSTPHAVWKKQLHT